MSSWIAAVKLLLEQRDPLLADEAELAALEPQTASLQTALEDLGRALALDNPDKLPTESLLTLLDKRLKDLATIWNATALNQGLAADARIQIERLGTKLASQTSKEATWAESWEVAVAGLGFTAQATPAAVEAAVKVWRDLPAHRIALESDRQRVSGMDRDIREFEQEANCLTGLIASDLPPLPPVDQARRLGKMLEHQTGQQLLSDNAEAQVRADASNLDVAERDVARDTELVLTRMSEFALTDDPAETLERLERAAAIRGRISSARATLIAQSDGFPEDQLRADLAEFDPQAALIAIEQLAQGFDPQDEEINRVFAAKSLAEQALIDAESGSGAEVALQQMKSAEVELEAAAREYLEL
jgi:uncharacterized protein YhaN